MVFAYNVSKIKRVMSALEKGETLDETEVKAALRVLVLYFVVFWENDQAQEPQSALQNFQALSKGVKALMKQGWSLRNMLGRIAEKFGSKDLQETMEHCERDFRSLLRERKLDKPPVTHIPRHSLYLVVSDALLSDLKDLENDEPIQEPPFPEHDSSYLRHVKVTRHASHGQ